MLISFSRDCWCFHNSQLTSVTTDHFSHFFSHFLIFLKHLLFNQYQPLPLYPFYISVLGFVGKSIDPRSAFQDLSITISIPAPCRNFLSVPRICLPVCLPLCLSYILPSHSPCTFHPSLSCCGFKASRKLKSFPLSHKV